MPHLTQVTVKNQRKWQQKYIALGAATYVPLEHSDLDKCIVLKNKYLCTNSFLVQQSADHTCTKAILWNHWSPIGKKIAFS